MLAAGLLAFVHLGGGCPTQRSSSEINSEIQEKEERKKEIEDELESYGGRLDDQGNWHIDFMGPLTRRDTRDHIRGLRTEWHGLNGDLYDLNDDLLDAQEQAAYDAAEESRDATIGTTGVPPHMH